MVGQIQLWSVAILLILAQAGYAENERRRLARAKSPEVVPACGEVLAEPEKPRSLIGNDDDLFVFDTNVLINDPNAFLRYRGTVVIPMQVLEELDGLKKDRSVGHVAREALRSLEALRKTGGIEADAVVYKTPNGTRLKFWTNPNASQQKAMGDSMDDQIVSAAIELAKNNLHKTWLISDDHGVLLRADILGKQHTLKLSRYAPDRLVEENAVAEGYSGLRELIVPDDVYQQISDTKTFRPADLLKLIAQDAYFPPLRPNEGVAIRLKDGPSPVEDVDNGLKCPLFRYKANLGQLVAVAKGYELKRRGVTPRNLEQRLAFDLAMDPDVMYLVISGQAGSGKNIVSFLAGLEQINLAGTQPETYQKILFLRTTATIGQDLGALPGTEEEKVLPHMKAVQDTLSAIEEAQSRDRSADDRTNKSNKNKPLYKQLKDSNKLVDGQATQFMRGSTIRKTLIIIDEAQNFRPNELDSLIDRVGPGSKVIILGDPQQVDPHFLNSMNNAMAVKLRSIESAFESLPANSSQLKGTDLGIVGMVRLWRAERSDVVRANLALKNQQDPE